MPAITVPKPITTPAPTHTPYNTATAAWNAYTPQVTASPGPARPVGTLTNLFANPATPKPAATPASVPSWWSKVTPVMSTPNYQAQAQRGTAPSVGNILSHSSGFNLPKGYTMLGNLSGAERWSALGIDPSQYGQAAMQEQQQKLTGYLQTLPTEMKAAIAQQMPEALAWQVFGQSAIPVAKGGAYTTPATTPAPVPPPAAVVGPVNYTTPQQSAQMAAAVIPPPATPAAATATGAAQKAQTPEQAQQLKDYTAAMNKFYYNRSKGIPAQKPTKPSWM